MDRIDWAVLGIITLGLALALTFGYGLADNLWRWQ